LLTLSNQKKILEISPDLIINATAYTAVDKAEEDQKTANLINHLAVKNIADICNQLEMLVDSCVNGLCI